MTKMNLWFHLSALFYLISLWIVARRKDGLYFFNSNRLGVFFRFLLVVYRLGDLPNPRASVHSNVTVCRASFFLAMIHSPYRLLAEAYLRRKRSIRPALSTMFCFPV